MRKTYLLPAAGIALVLALSVAVGVRGARPGSAVGQEATQTPRKLTPVPTEQYADAGFPSEKEVKADGVTGRVAIQPRANVANGEPAFTAADVVAFLRSEEHPFEMIDPGRGEPTIEAIKFISAGEAGSRIGHNVPVPDDTLVCLVTMRGEFDDDEDYSGTTSHLVFNGRTGNLLMVTVQP